MNIVRPKWRRLPWRLLFPLGSWLTFFVSAKPLLSCPLLGLSQLTEACEIFRKCNPYFELHQLPSWIWKAEAAVDIMSLRTIVLGRKCWGCNPFGGLYCYTFWHRQVTLLSGQCILDPHFHCRGPGLSLEANSRHSGLSQGVSAEDWILEDDTTETRVLPAKMCHSIYHLLLSPWISVDLNTSII